MQSIAASQGSVQVLDWLCNNGHPIKNHQNLLMGASLRDQRSVLLWAREHDIMWDETTCACAAFKGNLPLLQWLWENQCPWDIRTLLYARRKGHYHILRWVFSHGRGEHFRSLYTSHCVDARVLVRSLFGIFLAYKLASWFTRDE